jgi:two-component system phosphate regulon response regulator PhoB
MKPLVLIYSEDAEFYLILSHILQVDGFATDLAGSPDETLSSASNKPVRAIVVDCQPASLVGAELCTQLKRDSRTSNIPIVALIARGAEAQYIDLLKAGVDECLTRPFAPAKLLDYLRSKTGGAAVPADAERGKHLVYGDVEMSLDNRRVRRAGKEIFLGPIEFKLLRYMLENPERVLSRDELIRAAWQNKSDVGGRTVDVHIGNLRKALKLASKGDVIRTVRSAGYALDDQSARPKK